jgi:hypothetical protein
MLPLASHCAMAELARILVRASLPDRNDVTSVEALGEASGLTRRVLQRRCQVAGVTAHACVNFVQCLKLILGPKTMWEPAALLPCSDPRTLKRILAQAGLLGASPPPVEEFIRTQHFLAQPALQRAIVTELSKLDLL